VNKAVHTANDVAYCIVGWLLVGHTGEFQPDLGQGLITLTESQGSPEINVMSAHSIVRQLNDG